MLDPISNTWTQDQDGLQLEAERELDDGVRLVVKAMIYRVLGEGYRGTWWVSATADLGTKAFVQAHDTDDIVNVASTKTIQTMFEEQSSLAANQVIAQVRAAVAVWNNPGLAVT